MDHCKHQIDDELQKVYEERVLEVNKNKSIINELKIKNDHYLNFTLSILNLKKFSPDNRLIKYVSIQLNNVLIM